MAKKIAQQNECRHPPPRKQVLLLSCMDLRLLDDTVEFMNDYNLVNRYDQVVFAGAALGVMHLSSPPVDPTQTPNSSAWKDVFFHQLQVAIDVLGRKIKDVFILEHRDCGAYEHFHPTHRHPYCEGEEGLEEEHHREQAFLLAKKIREYCDVQQQQARAAIHKATEAKCEADRIKAEERLKAWSDIHVRCFLMNLDGSVKHLCEQEAKTTQAKKLPDGAKTLPVSKTAAPNRRGRPT